MLVAGLSDHVWLGNRVRVKDFTKGSVGHMNSLH